MTNEAQPASSPPDEPAGRAPARRWTIWDAAIGLLIAFTGSSLFAGVWATAVGPGDEPGLGAVVAAISGLWVGFVGWPWWLSRRRGTGSLATDFGVSMRFPFDPLVGLPLGIFCQLGMVWLIYLPIRLFLPDLHDDVSAPAERLTSFAEGAGVLVLLVIIVFLTPIAEEIFFRGLVLRAVGGRYGAVAGVVISSAVFAASHLQLIQAPALFALGAVLGTFAQVTGRLGIAIAGHMAFNAVTFTLLVFLD